MYRQRKRLCRGIIVTLFFFVLIGMQVTVKAEEKKESPTKKIRVAFPMQGGLTYKDEDENYRGYTYDYLQEIAQYTGWEYEFIEVPGDINDSLTTMMDMLSAGELDIMGGMVKNEQTQELWDFPEYGYGFNYTTLGTLEENTQITKDNFQGIQNLRIAILKSSVRIRSKLEAFFQVNNINYTFVDCETSEDSMEALQTKKADVVVGTDLVPVEGIRTVAQFNGSQYYFAVPKGRTDMLKELNRSILAIKQGKPYFESTLYNKYFSNRSDEIYLSDEEKAYVEAAEPLKIAVLENMAPIQYKDDSGNMKGIAIDILKKTEDDTGLKFEYVPVRDYKEAFELVSKKEIDAVCGIPYDYNLAQEHDLMLSSRFLNTQLVLVKQEGEEQTGSTEELDELEGLDMPAQGMDSIAAGKTDSLYMNLYSAEYMSNSAKYKNLRLIPQTDKTIDLCIGIRKPANSHLVSLLSNVLNLSDTDLESIIYQNVTDREEKITLRTFIEENPFLSLGLIIVVFALLAAAFFMIFYIRLKASKRLVVENLRYLRLCEMANEYIFEYDCQKDIISFSKEFERLFSLPKEVQDFAAILKGEKHASNTLNPDILNLFRNLLKTEEEAEFEVLCRMPDGKQRWFSCTHAKVENQDGSTAYYIGKLTDVQEEKEEKEKLEQQLLIDGLTGIYNAAASKDIIGECLYKLPQTGALLMIDIDYFKDVNDRLGHYVGDIVLKEFAGMLHESIGKWDIAGRMGGDEFIVYINDCDNERLLSALCEELCKKADKVYFGEDGIQLKISISIGGVLIRNKCSFADAYRMADKQLYASKSKGRACYTLTEYPASERKEEL